MNILGISALDQDSTATVVQDGRVIAAASEERFTRKKLQEGFPAHAVAAVLDISGLTPADIDAVAYPFFSSRKEAGMRRRVLLQHAVGNVLREPNPIISTKNALRAVATVWREGNGLLKQWDDALLAGLQEFQLQSKLHRYDHQLCHAAAAFYTSGFAESLLVSIDNYGSGAAGGAFLGTAAGIEELHQIPFPHSMGMFYARVTENLGFKPNRHEGKITGLAAHGGNEEATALLRQKFARVPGEIVYVSPFDQSIDQVLVKDYSREDVAAAYQTVLEEVVCEYCQYYLRKTGQTRIALAGGVFANVKLNQKIATLPEVEEIFIHPGMSDVGTGTGAALLHASRNGSIVPYAIEHVYLGPTFAQEEIANVLARHGITAEYHEVIEKVIAKLLAQGHIVGRFNGAMEYGPRALGNRSILCPATDPAIHQELNSRLHRTEFMPFAPVTLYEKRHDCYEALEKCEHACEFMTITCKGTEQLSKQSPAVVHVDGTARPQLIRKEVNPSYHRIVEEYYRLTGIPTLVNTSFNIHEEPIVCTPEDALRTLQDGSVDYLALGNYLIESPLETR